MIPDKEAVNINQEILNLFLDDGFPHKDPRATFFRNHNREMHSRNMEHVVTQHRCPSRTCIMATAHNICQTLAKLNRKHCFTLSLGFTLIHEWSSDWLFVQSNEHYQTPPKLGQSQTRFSQLKPASLKPYISKKNVATQVTPKQMARLSKFHSRE